MSNDDDDSSSHFEKLLPANDRSLPFIRVTRSSSPDIAGSSENEDYKFVTQNDRCDQYRQTIAPNHVGNFDLSNSWLLQGQRTISERTCSADASLSSSSLSSVNSSFPLSLSPKPPDGGWGWMVVLGCFIILFICEGLPNCFGLIYSELLVQFEESRSKTSLVGSIFFGVSTILGPFASAMTTRYGCRKTTIIGGILSSAGFLLSFFATSIEMLCITLGVVVGIGFSFCFVTSAIIVHFYFDKRRGFATGLSVCGTGVGTFTLAPLMDFLIVEYSWRGMMLILSGISLNIVVCGMLFRPLKFTEKQRLEHFSAEFDKLPSRQVKLQQRMQRNNSKCTELTIDVETLDDESRTISMPNLPARGNTTNGLSKLLIQAMAKNRKSSQQYKKNTVGQTVDEKTSETHGAQVDEMLNNVIVSEEIFQENEVNTTLEVPNNAFKTNQTLTNSSVTLKSSTESKQILEDFSEISQFLKQNEALRSKSALSVTSGIHLGKHNALGTQHLLYLTDDFYKLQLSKTVTNSPRLLGTSCPELVKSNVQSTIKRKGLLQYIKRRFVKTYDFLTNMMDLSLFCNVFFTVFVISNFMTYFWNDVPYLFIKEYAIGEGVGEREASFIISVLGIVNTIGQVIFGIIGDSRKINLINIYAIALTLAGVFISLVPFLTNFLSLAVIYALFGLFGSVYFPFETVLLVNYLGVKQLTNAYGVLLLMQGLANILGPPFAGWISDMTKSYDLAFYLSGIFCAFSGLVMLLIFIPGCKVSKVVNPDHEKEEYYDIEQDRPKRMKKGRR